MMYKTETVIQQYSDDKNLSARYNLHLKHSTNKQGFTAWLWDKYAFFDGCQILELGCGNGSQWENRICSLPDDCKIILSDFSSGMLSIVKEKYKSKKPFSFQHIDIQDIPYQNEAFDVIIANHMLYHVPDLTKALSEVKRVLKVGGKFYSSTNGNGGMLTFLHEAFKRFDPDTKAYSEQFSFGLQNGYEILSQYFSNVKRLDYEDSLSITETQDLMNWIKSSGTIMESYSEQDLSGLFDCFEDIRKTKGAINIPKETGLFISTK